MGKHNNNAVILFARDPILGQVKTRLNSFLDDETILKLYKCFLEDSLAKIQQVGNADCFVGISHENNSGFFNKLESFGMTLFSQQGKDLGDKMRRAFIDRFMQGYNKVVIIGSDSPSLPVSYINKALDSERDLVLGPSIDGGYYLIAMRGKVFEVFSGVDWGTDKVLYETLQRVKEGSFSFDLLPVWYDVDLPEDLKFLKTHLLLITQAGLSDGGMTKSILDEISIE
ncbi:MAG: TIGR04282 family arsenosugar biosynthesis glycosyltransferase [Nitrospinota bacterium]|nr:TIGR04282 family arsenosugar biosynthesis glycosyltransferase [Nitrospinota bacterium]